MSITSRLTTIAAAGSAGGGNSWIVTTRTSGVSTDNTACVALDSQDNIISVQRRLTAPSEPMYLLKFDPDGGDIWQRKYTPASSSFNPVGVTLDSSDNIIIAGQTAGQSSLTRVSPDGTTITWSKYASTADDTMYVVANDGTYAYFVGKSYSNANSWYMKGIYRYAISNGSVSWTYEFYAGNNTFFTDVKVMPNGNLLVAAVNQSDSPQTGVSGVISQSTGDQLSSAKWRKATYMNYGRGIAADSTNNIYHVGETYQTGSPELYVVKMDSGHTAVAWKFRYTIPSGYTGMNVNKCVVSSDDTMLYVSLSCSATNTALGIIALDTSDGSVVWAKLFHAAVSGYIFPRGDIHVDSSGNIITAGVTTVQNATYGADGMILKISGDGAVANGTYGDYTVGDLATSAATWTVDNDFPSGSLGTRYDMTSGMGAFYSGTTTGITVDTSSTDFTNTLESI